MTRERQEAAGELIEPTRREGKGNPEVKEMEGWKMLDKGLNDQT